jgi:hypothetical protein
MLKKFVFIALLLLSGSKAFASAEDSGWYVGLQIGESGSGNNGFKSLTDAFSSSSNNSSNDTIDTGDFAWRTYFGYLFNPFFGLELGFDKFSSNDFKKNDPNFTGYSISPRATDFVAKIAFPIGSFNIYGKLGVAYLEESLTLDSKKIDPSIITDITILQAMASAPLDVGNNNDFVGVFGLGGSYFINKSWAVDLSWTRFQGSGSNSSSNSSSSKSVDFVAIGVSYYLC